MKRLPATALLRQAELRRLGEPRIRSPIGLSQGCELPNEDAVSDTITLARSSLPLVSTPVGIPWASLAANPASIEDGDPPARTP
ncbi:MAG: hypothetical protein ACE5FG_14295 [Myxococcota bacterium]